MRPAQSRFGELAQASWSDWSPFFSLILRACLGLVAWALADDLVRRTLESVMGATPSSYFLVACAKISYAIAFATLVESLALLLKFTKWKRADVVEGWLTSLFLGIVLCPVRWPESESLVSTADLFTFAIAFVSLFLINRSRVRRLIREGDEDHA